MHIKRFDIQNFRKLKCCKIELSDKTTVFVGANNSGKTSAMDALAKFLSTRKFVFNDITLSNRKKLDDIGDAWIKGEKLDFEKCIQEIEQIMPTLDVWIGVMDNELHYVSNIIPTLDWTGGVLGVRFIYLPKNIEKLYASYKDAYEAAVKTCGSSSKVKLALWPQNLCDYLGKRDLFHTLFEIKAYVLDPSKMNNDDLQATDYLMECTTSNPLSGLVKIDIIGAQRGFSDTGDENAGDVNYHAQSLSSQLKSYYDKHLDPENEPSPEDLRTLQAMEKAKKAFNNTLSDKFHDAILELEDLGYPGVNDPKITIESKVSASESLSHDAAVQYALTSKSKEDLRLPEKYNGLGYQNLISMVFLLMRFRDDWMRTGKANKELLENGIEPLHIVLLEEPEAHLHVQVQQVFIKKAYDVLTNSQFLKEHGNFQTQLVISSHSSHIAREVDFKDLRYFKRLSATKDCIVPVSKVINLSGVFGEDNETTRFITRYLRTTHCDLFFADAAILVEGSAEYMLLPHFIRNKYSELNQRYITLLEINGRHSQRLKPLIEKMCLPTLIITDLDSGEPTGHHKHILPERGKGIISTNYAITQWVLKEKSLDKLMNFSEKKKEKSFATPYSFKMRIAYQMPIEFEYNGKIYEALPSTFEDSLVYSNFKLFSTTKGEGLMGNIYDACNEGLDFESYHEKIYNLFRGENVPKAGFALDLIFSVDPQILQVPNYIHEGLLWLQDLLDKNN
ncbi:MAG: AAA family ATPase [Lachnospiraceae bacterium]|nr:AAA family ATPase [Lachnospiraceae bacterium]